MWTLIYWNPCKAENIYCWHLLLLWELERERVGGREREERKDNSNFSQKSKEHMLELCSAVCVQSRVICLWAALLGQEVPYCLSDSGEPHQDLSFEELNLLFLKLPFIKWGSQAIRTLGLMYPIKDWVLFVLQQKSLWTSHCALQIKAVGILAVQSCRGSSGVQGKYGARPQATLAGDKGELQTHRCLAGGWEGDAATSSNGGRKRSLNFLPLSCYFVPVQ